MAKKRYKKKETLSDAITLIVIGLIMGTVFTFGMQFWSAAVSREECRVVETTFVDYEVVSRRGRVNEIIVECADGARFYIDGASVTDELRTELSELPLRGEITLLIHPNSSTILEFICGDEMLLEFENTMEALEGEAREFLWLGLAMYALSLYGVYCLIRILHIRKQFNSAKKGSRRS